MKTKINGSSALPTILIVLSFIIIGVLVLSCSNSPVAAGPGSGTGVGNGVALGKVLYADSTPLIGATVRLRRQSFLADTSGKLTNAGLGIATVYTDSTGAFKVDSLDTLFTYSIEVNNNKDSAEGTWYKFGFDSTDTARLLTRIVAPMPRFVGSVKLAGLPQNAYIQIYGLERIGRTDSLGNFIITELPVGKCEQRECEYVLHVLARQPDGSLKASIYEMELSAGLNGNVVHMDLELANGLMKQKH
ncbi:MAG: hypothetical protein PHC61_07980 [Chitinivibrionales bacterium]|nr:hypothetical protein [Chitinivibrionales bacterium]